MADNRINFQDLSGEAISAIQEAAVKALYESAGELEAEVIRNSAVGKVHGGQTKNSWQYIVDEDKLEAFVGSPLQNAIWEEFGTGEYALHGDGRKGGWYISIGNGENQMSEAVAAAYNFKIITNKNGQKFAFTRGKKPKRTLYNAYVKKKNTLIKIIKRAFNK